MVVRVGKHHRFRTDCGALTDSHDSTHAIDVDPRSQMRLIPENESPVIASDVYVFIEDRSRMHLDITRPTDANTICNACAVPKQAKATPSETLPFRRDTCPRRLPHVARYPSIQKLATRRSSQSGKIDAAVNTSIRNRASFECCGGRMKVRLEPDPDFDSQFVLQRTNIPLYLRFHENGVS